MLFQVCLLCPKVASPYSEQAEDPALLLNEPEDCGRWLALPLWPWVLYVGNCGSVISEKASHCNTWKIDCVAEMRDLFFFSQCSCSCRLVDGASMKSLVQMFQWVQYSGHLLACGYVSLVGGAANLPSFFLMIDSGTW